MIVLFLTDHHRLMSKAKQRFDVMCFCGFFLQVQSIAHMVGHGEDEGIVTSSFFLIWFYNRNYSSVNDYFSVKIISMVYMTYTVFMGFSLRHLRSSLMKMQLS